jgi:mannose-6-phosphate isomerase-like protein (cupin superfamily)
MGASFDLNHATLAAHPHFAELAKKLNTLSPIDSPASFNHYAHEACRLWKTQFPNGIGKTQEFDQLVAEVESGGPNIIPTGWGGVVITFHEHPRVEKYLVVRAGGYLALEKHEQKDERLEVREGAGLIWWRQPNDHSLTVEFLRPGDHFHFTPGIEHCLIGTEDLLVFERSTDPKGMDQDLIFIFEPDEITASEPT